MMDSVGIRISVRGMMPAIMARRVSSVTRRSTGPITKPMNRSMPVHSAPVMTWTKSRTQRLGERIAAIIAAKAAAAAAALAAMMAAILSPSLWVLDFVHVMTGALWTGIDLFMGFVIGPVLRRVTLDTRRAMIAGIIPRTLILMPTLSIITSTSGWFLAVRLGYLDLGYPQFWWVIAALVIVSLLTVQGLGILLPMNLRLYFEIMKPVPDPEKLKRWMRTYV